MSNSIIALLVAASAATWIYTKVLRRTGNNNKSAITLGAMTFVFAFVFVLGILSFLNDYLQQ